MPNALTQSCRRASPRAARISRARGRGRIAGAAAMLLASLAKNCATVGLPIHNVIRPSSFLINLFHSQYIEYHLPIALSFSIYTASLVSKLFVGCILY